MLDKIKLESCPYCGGEAEFHISNYENGDTTHLYTIMCKDAFGCGAKMSDSISYWEADYEDAVNKLVQRWNRRAINYTPSRVAGYDLKPLLLFADACRKSGVSEKDLAQFVKDTEFVYKYVSTEIQQVQEAALRKMMNGDFKTPEQAIERKE